MYNLGLFVVCPSVRASSCTTGYGAANEWHKRVVKIDINVAIFLKRLRSRWKQANVRSIAHAPSPAGYIVRTRHVNFSPEHALRHIGCMIHRLLFG